MLSAKPWKPDAILRLLLSVFVCIFAGSLLPSLWQHSSKAGGVTAKLILPLTIISLCSWVATLVLLNKPWQLETLNADCWRYWPASAPAFSPVPW